MSCGVYKITNKENGKFYIGSSKNIHKRWVRHLRDLKIGEHNNIHLQRAFNLKGEDGFKFEILEYCEQEKLLITEQAYLDKTRCWDFEIGYNIGRTASGGDNLSSHPDKENIIKRIADSTRKRMKNLTEEEKQIKSEKSSGDKNPNWRGGISKKKCSHCKKDIAYMSKMCLGCSKIGSLNPFYGKQHSEETKEKIRQSNIGRLPPSSKRIQINGQIFESAAKAALRFGVTTGTILNWLNNKVKIPNKIYEIKELPKLQVDI